MSLAAKLRRTPLRAVTGAYIVNSGVGKFSAGDDTAKALHGLACGTYPFLEKVQPKLFAKGLAAGEVAVGSVLLLPFVSPVVAGAVLTGFSGALLKLYWNTEGMHEPNDPRPTQQGVAVVQGRLDVRHRHGARSPTACSSRRTTSGSRSAPP